jgi:hypothetical protein
MRLEFLVLDDLVLSSETKGTDLFIVNNHYHQGSLYKRHSNRKGGTVDTVIDEALAGPHNF